MILTLLTKHIFSDKLKITNKVTCLLSHFVPRKSRYREDRKEPWAKQVCSNCHVKNYWSKEKKINSAKFYLFIFLFHSKCFFTQLF